LNNRLAFRDGEPRRSCASPPDIPFIISLSRRGSLHQPRHRLIVFIRRR